MQITTPQKRFFDAFGYLFLPGLAADAIDWITAEVEAAFAASQQVHDGQERSGFGAQLQERERACSLLDLPAIDGLLTGLLGDDYNFLGMGADFYVGDNLWHPDSPHDLVRHVKLAMYLDPLTKENGALRVVPGSHRWGMVGNLDTEALWGVRPEQVPCDSPGNTPGDVGIFDLKTLHTAIGGGTRRRMLNLVCAARCHTPDQLAQLDQRLAGNQGSIYSEAMRQTATEQRRRHLQQVLEREALRDQGAVPA